MKHPKDNLQVISFKSADIFETWLKKNQNLQTGIWVRFYKKASGITTVTYDEALDVALCYGWIDGLVNKLDENSYMQKFTPRRARSIWSKRNVGHIARLIREGRMTERGLEEVEKAKKDGRWDSAYSSPSNMAIPPDLTKALSRSKKSKTFYETLSKTNKYAIAWRLETAKKPETREKRLKIIMEMLKNGQKFH